MASEKDTPQLKSIYIGDKYKCPIYIGGGGGGLQSLERKCFLTFVCPIKMVLILCWYLLGKMYHLALVVGG